jgi:hypothetical protein
MAWLGCRQLPSRTETDPGGPLARGRAGRACLRQPSASVAAGCCAPASRRLPSSKATPPGRGRPGWQDHGPAVRRPGPARQPPAAWPRRPGGRRRVEVQEAAAYRRSLDVDGEPAAGLSFEQGGLAHPGDIRSETPKVRLKTLSKYRARRGGSLQSHPVTKTEFRPATLRSASGRQIKVPGTLCHTEMCGIPALIRSAGGAGWGGWRC